MNQDFIQSIQDKKRKVAEAELAAQRQGEIVGGSEDVKRAVLEAARANVEAFVSHQPKTEVKNFPQELATSEDIRALTEAVRATQSDTQETTENSSKSLETLLAGISDKLASIESQDHTSDILTALSSLETSLEDKDVTVANIDDMADFFFSLEQALESKDMVVNVDKPDLAPLATKLDDVKKAIESKEVPVIPEFPEVSFPTELFAEILSELQYQRTILQKILTRPIPVGSGSALSVASSGGGGGSVASVYDTAVYGTGTYS